MINKIIEFASYNNCSDVHLSVGLPPVYRKNGRLIKGDGILSKEDISLIVADMTTEHQRQQLLDLLEVDFAFMVGRVRLRVNIYRENGTLAVAIRLLRESIPSLRDLSLPTSLERLANLSGGLVLVTGPTGSGKSTTLAAMIDYINQNKAQHIITLEDPVEYLHQHKSSIIHQREIGRDLVSFSAGLRSALREDPAVILVGELRSLETFSSAIASS